MISNKVKLFLSMIREAVSRRLNPALKKGLALLLGLLLALACAELALWAFGNFMLRRQAGRNQAAARAGNDYRILCLGESTTIGQYPPFLERALNSAGKKYGF
ncbi:MAG TPA: hypothetical protein PLL10_07585, partial [Elusimicrobiales bacterium]|nr:hypothetical protein [Elusimicrobiales bacterium]